MKASHNALVKQLRRVLFAEEGVDNNENRPPSVPKDSLGTLGNLKKAPNQKTRRGQRQKWTRQDDSRIESSVLANLDNASLASENSRAGRTKVNQDQGLLALFATPAEEKKPTKRR